MKSPAAASRALEAITNTSRVASWSVGFLSAWMRLFWEETVTRRHQSIQRCSTKSSRMTKIVMEITFRSKIFENIFLLKLGPDWFAQTVCTRLHTKVFSAVTLRHNVSVVWSTIYTSVWLPVCFILFMNNSQWSEFFFCFLTVCWDKTYAAPLSFLIRPAKLEEIMLTVNK